jgi:Pyruvate/2-oxoacid:ferredoxin oxidoreductase delta subunit
MKRCKNCFAFKPQESFNKRKGTPDGLQYVCKGCSKELVYSYRQEKIHKRWDEIFSKATK